jgi:hypothetical protein
MVCAAGDPSSRPMAATGRRGTLAVDGDRAADAGRPPNSRARGYRFDQRVVASAAASGVQRRTTCAEARRPAALAVDHVRPSRPRPLATSEERLGPSPRPDEGLPAASGVGAVGAHRAGAVGEAPDARHRRRTVQQEVQQGAGQDAPPGRTGPFVGFLSAGLKGSTATVSCRARGRRPSFGHSAADAVAPNVSTYCTLRIR